MEFVIITKADKYPLKIGQYLKNIMIENISTRICICLLILAEMYQMCLFGWVGFY